jgi:hypothetical protein
MSARFLWLVDVEGPGLRLRYSTEDVEVPGAAGGAYRAGLEDISAGQGDPEIDVAISDSSVDWAASQAALVYASCTLRRWQVGTGIASAETYSRGVVDQLHYGTPAEPVSWMIAAAESDPLPQCPDPAAQVWGFSAPDDPGAPYPTLEIPPNQRGQRYPLVFGWPGYQPGLRSDTDTWPVVPVPMRQQVPHANGLGLTSTQIADVAEIVVSEDPSTTRPTTVFLWDDTAGVGADEDVSVTSDLSGRRIAVADLVNDISIYPAPEGPAFYAGYGPAGDANPTRDAYSVITYMLRRFGGESVDWDRMPELEDFLGVFQVDTYLNADVGDVWAWLEDVLVPSLPVAIRTSTKGRYLQPIRYTVDPRRTVRELDVQRSGSVRVGPVEVSGAPRNHFQAQFQDTALGYMGVQVMGVPDELGTIGHGLCVASQARYGFRPAADVTLTWTWDTTTALRVLTWMAERDAFPARRFRAWVPEELRLREGYQVRLVDEDVGLDDLAIVDGPPLTGGSSGVSVTFRIPGR